MLLAWARPASCAWAAAAAAAIAVASPLMTAAAGAAAAAAAAVWRSWKVGSSSSTAAQAAQMVWWGMQARCVGEGHKQGIKHATLIVFKRSLGAALFAIMRGRAVEEAMRSVLGSTEARTWAATLEPCLCSGGAAGLHEVQQVAHQVGLTPPVQA